jgi:class 3 adenylate cyclase/PAS domain-containing protein
MRIEAPVTVERQALIEAERRLRMLDAVAYAATRMVAGAEWRNHVDDLLARLGQATDMSRVTLFEVHPGLDGHRVQSCRHDWAETGLASIAKDPRYQDMPLSDDGIPGNLNEWSARRERGEVIQATLAETAGYTRQVFLEHGTLSFLSVPVMVEGRWWGFLGFDDCKHERVWSEAEINVLKTAAAVIAGAVERERANEQIRLSEERYELASRGANDGLWDWDVTAGKTFFSSRLYEVMRLPPASLGADIDALIGKFVSTDADYLRAMLKHKFARREENFDVECRLESEPGKKRWLVMRGLIVFDGEKPRRVVGGLRDITRRMEVQQVLSETERKRANLARYFSPNMVSDLMQSGGRLTEARTQIVTVLFADIWSFSRVSARLSGNDVMSLLREYLGLVEKAVFAHGGTLDKFLGDGLMATFGTPETGPQDAANALACAKAMTDAVVRWNLRREERKLQPLRLGIGLHHGEVVLGDIGSERRMEFAVLGDTVNVASRIQEMTRKLDIAILASEAVIGAAKRDAGKEAIKGYRDMGLHRMRGRGGTIRLWGRAAEGGKI